MLGSRREQEKRVDELFQRGKKKLSWFQQQNVDGKKYLFINEDNALYYGENGKEAVKVGEGIEDIITYDCNYTYFIYDGQLYYYKAGTKESIKLDINAEVLFHFNTFMNID